MGVYVHQKTCTVMLIYGGFIHNSRRLKQPRCPSTREWISKFVVCLYSGVLPSSKKGQTTDAHKNMDESQKYKVEWKKSQTQDSTFCMIPWCSKTGKADQWWPVCGRWKWWWGYWLVGGTGNVLYLDVGLYVCKNLSGLHMGIYALLCI